MRRHAIGDLVTIGWPLVPPWPDVDPNLASLIQGERIAFGADDDRAAMARFIAAMERQARNGKTYIIIVPHDDWRRCRTRDFCAGWTVFAQGESVLRYQSIVFETGFARSQGVCAEGVFFEIDAPHVSAWNGSALGETPRLIH